MRCGDGGLIIAKRRNGPTDVSEVTVIAGDLARSGFGFRLRLLEVSCRASCS